MLTALAAPASSAPSRPVRALIVDGQNNHDWRRTTAELRATLRAAGIFQIAVTTTPDKGADARRGTGWQPDIRRHQGGHQLQRRRVAGARPGAFVAYVDGGGGVVMVHAANNPFPEWQEFNEIIGLGWRKADYGARVTVDDASGALVRTPAGEVPGPATAHPTCSRSRPGGRIIRSCVAFPGVDPRQGQLRTDSAAPRGTCTCSTARSRQGQGGTGAHEPMTWVVPFGQGRVVTTMLGHQWRDQADAPSSASASGPCSPAAWRWVAPGSVSLPVPADFPTAEKVSIAAN